MPSSWSSSLRFELQFTGENINLWGDKLNAVLGHADYAVAGWLNRPLTGDYALTTANAGDDEARAAMIKFTGGGPFTVTIPSVSKAYDIWNACSGTVTLTTGAGSTAVLQAGETARVLCDASNVKRVAPNVFGAGPFSMSGALDMGASKITSVADPSNPQDVATKAYADALAFTANAGILPGQGSASGQALFSNGSNALWKPISAADLSDFNSKILGVQVALAVAL